MKLCVSAKLVDTITKNVVGIQYRDYDIDEPRIIPFSINTAKTLGLEDADIIDYLDVDVVEVLVHGNSYALTSNSLCTLEHLEDTPFEQESNKVILWGRVFEPYHLVPFISNLEEVNYGEYCVV